MSDSWACADHSAIRRSNPSNTPSANSPGHRRRSAPAPLFSLRSSCPLNKPIQLTALIQCEKVVAPTDMFVTDKNLRNRTPVAARHHFFALRCVVFNIDLAENHTLLRQQAL